MWRTSSRKREQRAMTKQSDRLSQAGVNLPELLLRVENDLDLLGELIGIFNEEFPRLIRSLQDSIDRGDMKQVEATSHTLKGMLSEISVTRAAALASQLEQMAREGKSSGFSDLVNLLEREVKIVLPELDAYKTSTEP
jgi:HPt (histidine-containing phosphotransfer) domain-containing protein